MKQLIFTVILFAIFGCKKHHEDPLVIIPTVNPIPYSVQVFLITPTDKKFDGNSYKGIKSAILNIQEWYRGQLGVTFTLNPVVVDTISGLHETTWYGANNGFNGSTRYAYYNALHEIKELLGANYDSSHIVYFTFIQSNFPDETVPKGLAVEGSDNIKGLVNGGHTALGASGHALGHAFGLPEVQVTNDQAIMSTGFPLYPNCILVQAEKDSLLNTNFF